MRIIIDVYTTPESVEQALESAIAALRTAILADPCRIPIIVQGVQVGRITVDSDDALQL